MKKLLLSFLLVVTAMMFPAMADTYSLVTDAASLANGDEVILVGENEATFYAMSPTVTSNKIKSVKVECTNDVITLDADHGAQILTLVSTTQDPTKFAFQKKGGSDFVIKGSGNTDTKYGTPAVYDAISVSNNGEAVIYITSGSNKRKLRFYVGGADFRGYTDNSATPVYIYKLNSGMVATSSDGQTITNNGDVSIVEGTTLTFSATNAEKIEIYDENDAIIETSEGTPSPSNLSWTPSVTSSDGMFVTVKAYMGEEKTIELTFILTVKALELGEIIVTYGNGEIVSDNHTEPITVEAGTEFTATAENATYIKVVTSRGTVVEGYDNTVSWSFNDIIEEEGVTVTASLEGQEDKVFMFRVEVIEPVVPENEIWALVKSTNELYKGGRYIIGYASGKSAMSTTNNNNSRLDTSVTMEDGDIINPSDNVLKFELEVNTTDNNVTYLWRALNYLGTDGTIKDGYLYNSGSNTNLNLGMPEDTNLSQRNSIVEFDGSNAIIKFGGTRQVYHCVVNKVPQYRCYANANNNEAALVQIYRLVEDPEVPTFDQIVDDPTQVAFKSTKGELHVWTAEYDSNGTLVKENGNEITASIVAKVPADNDFTWTNKVRDQDDVYEIPVPSTVGNYLKIRAKAVIVDKHSEELVKNVDASGNVISGVEGVVADDENAPVEYFNLQGVRVAADQPGIYIRRQGSKVEKVSIAR